MDLKILVFLLVVGVCTAYWGEKRISIDETGAKIEITTEDGKRIEIVRDKAGLSGKKSINIEVSGPNMRPKSVRINDEHEGYYDSPSETYARMKRSSRGYEKKSQGDILFELCREYRGINDDKTYKKFLEKLEKHVLKGDVDPSILDCMREVDSERAVEGSLLDLRGNYKRTGLWPLLQSKDRTGLLDSGDLLRRTLYDRRTGLEDIESRRLDYDDVLRRSILERELADKYERLPLTRDEYLRDDPLVRPYDLRFLDDSGCKCGCQENGGCKGTLCDKGYKCTRCGKSICSCECGKQIRDVLLRNRLYGERESPLILDRLLDRRGDLDLSRRRLLDDDSLRDLSRWDEEERYIRPELYERRPYDLRGRLDDELLLRRPYEDLKYRQDLGRYEGYLDRLPTRSYPLSWRGLALRDEPLDEGRLLLRTRGLVY